jgi:hypothetical protein
MPSAQLLTLHFGPEAAFEGQLLGALQRLESGGTLRILDVLFIQNDRETGDLVAANLRGEGTGRIVAPLLSFRLDPSERRRMTERTLAGRPGGISPDTVRAIGEALAPGASVAAVLIDHAWLKPMEDAASRAGGTLSASRFLDVGDLDPLTSELLAEAGHTGG